MTHQLNSNQLQFNHLKTLQHYWKDAECELIHNNHFQLLLAILLSAQTTDQGVNRVMATLLNNNPNFNAHDLIQMGEKMFYQKIKTIGLAPQKSRYSIGMATLLIQNHASEPPQTYGELIQLPGVGRKTALVYLNIAQGANTIPVDTHVARVSKRLLISKSLASPLKVERDLESLVTNEFKRGLHLALVHHGRYICKAKKPECHRCPIQITCPSAHSVHQSVKDGKKESSIQKN